MLSGRYTPRVTWATALDVAQNLSYNPLTPHHQPHPNNSFYPSQIFYNLIWGMAQCSSRCPSIIGWIIKLYAKGLFGRAPPQLQCDRTAQFIQVQAQRFPFNMLMRTYLYKPGSPLSVTKDLGKLTSQPRSPD
jgi:hypothetical protein